MRWRAAPSYKAARSLLPLITHPLSPVLPRSLLLGAALGCAVFASSSSAAAADATITVSRDGPPSDPSCPDTYTLAERVRGLRTAGLSFGQGATAPRLVVTFVRQPDGTFQALVRASAPIEGERTLSDRGKGCGSLGEAVAVTMALLLDGASEDSDRAATRRVVQTVPVVRARASGQIFVGGGVTAGTVPETSAKIGAELVFQPLSRWRSISPEIGAGFAYVPSVDARLGPGTVASSATLGTLRAGIRFGLGTPAPGGSGSRFAIVPSLQLLAGRVYATGTGFEEDRASSRASGRTGFALPLVWEIAQGFSVRLVPEADVAWRVQRFVVSNLADTVTVPRVSVGATLAIGLSLF